MNTIIATIEKAKPAIEKISRNRYLRAIQDGFLAVIPVTLFTSLFLLIAYVPNVFGYYWPDDIANFIVKPYNYSMGILAVLVSATTAKALCASFNRDLPITNQISDQSTMIGAIVGFLILSSDAIKSGFDSSFLGSTGLLTAFLSAFVTVNVYYFCIKNNITIRLPKEVPPNLSESFKTVIPFGFNLLLLYLIDVLSRHFLGHNFAQEVLAFFQPLFSAADGYLGIAIIYGAMAMFWFVGIHGPSIVSPAINAIAFSNMAANLAAFQAGEHANHIVTSDTQAFIATFGGTGATFVVPYMFMFLAKSRQNKAVGRASVIPTTFGVNEPILFGGPLILNPIFLIPFITAPVANVWLFKFFVDVFGMNSSMFNLPWPTPAPIGIILTTSFDKLSFVLAALLIVVDTLIYYPFFKAYDNQIYAQELSKIDDTTNTSEQKNEVEIKKSDKITKVLVLCAGGGTSGLLANALVKAAKEYDVPVEAAAAGYGSHMDILKEFDLVVLAPQVASNYEHIKQDTDRLGIKLAKTEGVEYIKLTRDGQGALAFVQKQMEE
ncbi:TPA: PTS lactose transporter subunit IIBC [Streptococcus suis]|nr:PTS lactose transporter subunit IIBC [Streptococcus suis]